jgi:hypothetical protein
VQSEEQNWVQFAWELERVQKELEEFLAISDEQKITSAKELGSRLQVALGQIEVVCGHSRAGKVVTPPMDAGYTVQSLNN